VSDETRSRHLPSTSQKRSVVKARLIEHKTKWKPREFRITFPFDSDYFKVNTVKYMYSEGCLTVLRPHEIK